MIQSFSAIDEYFTNINYTSDEHKKVMNILHINIIDYLTKLMNNINNIQFITLVKKGLLSNNVKSLSMSIGQFQDSIYDIHENNDTKMLNLIGISSFTDKNISIQNVYDNLFTHFENIIPLKYDENICKKAQDNGSFYDDFYELILLGKYNMLPYNTTLKQSNICSEIHDAWAIKTFFKFDSDTSLFIFNIDGFKKNGNFNFSRFELCIDYKNLSPKEQIKDILTYCAISHTIRRNHINLYICSMNTLGFNHNVPNVSNPNIVNIPNRSSWINWLGC